MTNGGFETIRSKRSPATGSNREPSRNSIPSSPLSATLKRRCRARGGRCRWRRPRRRTGGRASPGCRTRCRGRAPDGPGRAPADRRAWWWPRRCRARAPPQCRAECELAEVRDDPPAAGAEVVDERVGRRSTVGWTSARRRGRAGARSRRCRSRRCRSRAVSLRSSPAATTRSTPADGNAASACARDTGSPRTKSVARVASGDDSRDASARSAATRDPRWSDAAASVPHSESSRSTVKPAASRSAAIAATAAGSVAIAGSRCAGRAAGVTGRRPRA